MWERGGFLATILEQLRRPCRPRHPYAVPRTSLQCVCTRRRNCIAQLSPSRPVCASDCRFSSPVLRALPRAAPARPSPTQVTRAVIFGSRCPRRRGLHCPHKRTSSVRPVRSEKCRYCSLIPGLAVKLSTIILAGPTVLFAVGVNPPHDGVR